MCELNSLYTCKHNSLYTCKHKKLFFGLKPTGSQPVFELCSLRKVLLDNITGLLVRRKVVALPDRIDQQLRYISIICRIIHSVFAKRKHTTLNHTVDSFANICFR
jgi:hypothetical protein